MPKEMIKHSKLQLKKDNAFCDTLKSKLEKVFKCVLLPELVTRKLDPSNKQIQKLYCYCKKPSYQPMIGCDSRSLAN